MLAWLILLMNSLLTAHCKRESNAPYGVCQVQSATCCVGCANTPTYAGFEDELESVEDFV
jgi:hypothetical protein